MADSGRTPRRGLSFPFFVSLVLFVAVLCDLWIGEPGFLSSAAYRSQHYIAAGAMIFGVLLWLWVLASARRRATRFEGPIETTRGSNGALQPILATIFVVSGVNLAYSHSVPKLLNLFVADSVTTEAFSLTGPVAAYRTGCERAPATAERFGAIELCLPEGVGAELDAATGDVVMVTGSSSWFGLEPRRYARLGAQPGGEVDAVGAPGDAAPVDAGPVEPGPGFDLPDSPPSTALDKLAQP
jgi:hypothetical protein